PPYGRSPPAPPAARTSGPSASSGPRTPSRRSTAPPATTMLNGLAGGGISGCRLSGCRNSGREAGSLIGDLRGDDGGPAGRAADVNATVQGGHPSRQALQSA